MSNYDGKFQCCKCDQVFTDEAGTMWPHLRHQCMVCFGCIGKENLESLRKLRREVEATADRIGAMIAAQDDWQSRGHQTGDMLEGCPLAHADASVGRQDPPSVRRQDKPLPYAKGTVSDPRARWVVHQACIALKDWTLHDGPDRRGVNRDDKAKLFYLAGMENLPPREAAAAARMIYRYRRQMPQDWVSVAVQILNDLDERGARR